MVISAKLGLRNLTRNRWRSGLTLAAVAVAVGLMVWTLSMYEGWINEMVRGATAVETGQVQVHTAGYVESPRVYRGFTPDSAMLQRIMAVRNVRAISPRVKAVGLIGNEQRSQVVQIKGVDPRLEAATTPIADAIVGGRWLSDDPAPYPAPREVVLGKGVAQQLGVVPGDTLVVFLEAADGSLGNDLLQVVGVVRTANTQVDRMAAYLHLKDAQYLTALDDQVQEL
ncbi:MAG TPA: ABC transporter permease, partial [Longimicrobiales bacterium]|nr:ABC transporter permease [Longimicrobiales bacterium]